MTTPPVVIRLTTWCLKIAVLTVLFLGVLVITAGGQADRLEGARSLPGVPVGASGARVLAGAGDPVTGVTVTLSTPKAGTLSQYTIQYTTTATGALAAGAGQIIIQFPIGTTVPSSITTSSIVVTTNANITPATKALAVAPVINAGTRTVTLTTPITIGNGDNISVVFQPPPD